MARPAGVSDSGRARSLLSVRRVAAATIVLGLAVVAFVGAAHPLPVAGGAGPAVSSASAPAYAAASATAGSVWSTGAAGFDIVDVGIKCVVVLALLFICLRVLGRLQTPPKKTGSRLEVLESRPLAPKASLHLVSIGERLLVVGLTPSGMVSLAELDSSEVAATQSEAALDGDDEAALRGFATAGGRAAPAFGGRAGTTAGSLPSALGPLVAPIDALTGRLVSFFGGGRAR
jgi:flagellar protein FliO/FliZ